MKAIAKENAITQNIANTTIVVNRNNELFVSHIILAEKTSNDKRSIARLIDNNIVDLEEFGKVGFEITAIKNSKNKENELKEYFLNEQQATLLMTYLRNNEIVREFKKNLVRAFFELEKQKQPRLLQKKLNIKELSREELEDFAQYVLDKYHEVNENNIYFRQSANKWFDNMNEAISQNLSMKDELEILTRKEKEEFKQLALDTSKQESEYLAYSFEAVGKELGLSRNKVFDFARLFCMIKKDNMPTKYFKDNFRIIDTEYKSGNGIRKYKQPMFLESGKEIFKKKLQKFLPQTI